MALITCPECGKENVSSLAVSCPDCGFPIKDYYDKIKAEKEQENLEIKEETERKELDKNEVAKTKEENQNNEIRSEISEKEKRQKAIIGAIQYDIEKLNKDKKPSLIAGCVFLGLTLLCMYYGKVLGFLSWILIAIFGFLTYFNFRVYYGCCSGLSQSEKDLILVQKSLDQYERAVKERVKEREKKSANRTEEEKKIYEAQHPTCPQCGSKDTKRISTANRAVSVGTLGIASSTIGKQYKCNKCKHMW